MKLYDVVEFISGTPQFRIHESTEIQAPIYSVYSQTDLLEDLSNTHSNRVDGKIIRTWDKVNRLVASDVLFSFISGDASIVRKGHEGYLYTQNYVKLVPDETMEAGYLVYLLNQDKTIERQLMAGLQGSQVLKYTLKQVKELEIPKLPSVKKQKMISEVYFKQLRLQAIKKRVNDLETTILLQRLRGSNLDERKSI